MIELLNEYKNFVYRGIIESIFLIIVTLYILKNTVVIEKVRSNKNSKKILIVFILIFFMQIFDRFQYFYPQQYDFYPFVRFAMYQAAPDGVELTSYKICMKDVSGNCREINIAKEYSSIGLPSLSSRFNYLVNEYPNSQVEIKVWLDSLKRLKINSENKVILQKAIFKKNKIEYINLVEVSFEE